MRLYRETLRGDKKAILSVARAGRFSSDRSMREDACDIWRIEKDLGVRGMAGRRVPYGPSARSAASYAFRYTIVLSSASRYSHPITPDLIHSILSAPPAGIELYGRKFRHPSEQQRNLFLGL